MIRVAIVEDDAACVSRLRELFERYGKERGLEFRFSEFFNGVDFVSEYTADYDLVCMDIDMPHMNGLEAAKELRKHDESVFLIFVTNLARYAIKGYEVDACEFFVKPVDYKTFCAKIERVIGKIQRSEEPFLVVESRDGKTKVLYSDIFYITVDGRYVLLHTRHGEIKMHISMKELEQLLEGSSFVRGDNSSIVNLMYVSSVNTEGAVVNGKLIPSSRNRRKALLDAFTLYLR